MPLSTVGSVLPVVGTGSGALIGGIAGGIIGDIPENNEN